MVQVGWCAQVDLGIVDGRRARRTIYGKTQRAVVQRKTEMLRERQRGTLPRDGSATVRAFLEAWLERKRPRIRPRTWEHYETNIRLHLVPQLGHLKLAALTPSDVEIMQDRLAARLSARTVAHCRAILRNALRTAERDGLVPRNVAALADPPVVRRPHTQTLTPVQARQLVQAVRETPDEGIWLLALICGLRLGEVLGLAWPDVDLEAGQLVVRHALQRLPAPGQRDKVLTLGPPKSESSQRTILLPRPVVAALAHRRAAQAAERLATKIWVDRWNLVFTGPAGQPRQARRVQEAFVVLLEQAGLPRIRFHDLRHTAASLLLAHRPDAKAAQELLGHSSVHLTLQTYQHVIDETRRKTRQDQEAIFGDG